MDEKETVITQGDTANEQGRTFTQEEVNAIVQNRLAKDRKERSDYDDLKEKARLYDEQVEAGKTELQKANEKAEGLEKELNDLKRTNAIKEARDKVAAENGIPANLLTGTTEEECAEQAKAILAFANKTPYPQVKDGGENTRQQKKSEVDQFADWFKAQRL